MVVFDRARPVDEEAKDKKAQRSKFIGGRAEINFGHRKCKRSSSAKRKRKTEAFHFKKLINRGVAQFGRALRSGRRGRRFESCRLDQKNPSTDVGGFFSYIRLRRVILLCSDIWLMPSDIVLRTV